MAFGDEIIKTAKEYCDISPDMPVIPRLTAENLLATMEHDAKEYAQKKEREELICRLLASGMPVDEVSLILKIRKEEISEIEQGNIHGRIPDYAKKLQARRRSRQRAAGGPG